MPVRLPVAGEPRDVPDSVVAAQAAELSETEAWAIVGGLSKPSKMPGYSYGLPATECKTGGKLASTDPTSICAACYALRGNYRWRNVVTAQYRRLRSLRDPLWAAAMVCLLRGRYGRSGVFRWHDSGDLQGRWHLERIAQVARLVPAVRFWLPTREYAMVATVGELPENLCVRLSALHVDAPVDLSGALAAYPTSTVHSMRGQPVVAPSGRTNDSLECRAYTRGNKCGACRACWSPRVRNVSYPLH